MTTPDLPVWLREALDPKPSFEALVEHRRAYEIHGKVSAVLAVELPRRVEALLRGMADNEGWAARAGDFSTLATKQLYRWADAVAQQKERKP